ncbi:MAG: hypothetical protein AAF721_25580, partial [Myxococcota bacterium]
MRRYLLVGVAIAVVGVGAGACTNSVGGDVEDTSAGDEAGSDSGASATEAGSSSDGAAPATDGDDGQGPVDGTVTYHRDLQPLLERHCVGCHAPGKIAPYALTSYEEVWPLREAIAEAVDQQVMPPWNPREGCAEYVGDPSLSAEAREMFGTWADGNGPVGDPADYVAPELPTPSGISRVDVSLPIPEPYTPTLSPDDYRCFLMDWPESEVSYITGFQVVPGNIETVHHVITYAISPSAVAAYEQLDADDPGPGYTCFGGPGASSGDWTAGRWLGAWAPGSETSDFPEGTGLRIEPGSKVVVQIHYNATGDDIEPDQTVVDYKVDSAVEREAFMMPWANPDWLSGAMPIPAGAPSTVHTWELDPTLVMSFLTDAIPGFSEFVIYSVSHHMHLRGVGGRQVIKRQDGSEECLVEMPRYDFNWQTRYRFKDHLKLPAGTKLEVTMGYDNTAGNPNNPDPTTEVKW